MAKYKPGDTRKSKKGLLRLSSSGKWFKTSNSPAANKQRALNARLDAPIANLPGTPYQSQTTERQLAHEAQAATTTQYGAKDSALNQALTQAVQHQSNVGGYYEDYKKNLQDLNAQATAYNQGAMAAMQNLPNLVTGLAGQAQGQVGQQQAQRGPEMGAIGAGTTNTNASNAAAISQAAAGSYGAQAALVGNANQQYNANLLNNVVPAQKIQDLNTAQQGITNAQSDITAQKGVEGAYNENYRNARRQDETKNLLAGATLGLNTAKATASTKIAAKNANTAAKKADASIAAENKRHAVALKNADTSAKRAAEQARHNQKMEELAASKAAKKAGGKAPDWKPSTAQSKARTQVTTLKSLAAKAKTGQAFVAGHGNQAPLSKAGATKKIQDAAEAPDDPILVTAAVEAAYDGSLSAYTVRSLIKAGYKPSLIADALGVPTAGQKIKKGSSTYVKPPKAPRTGSRGDGS